MSKVIPLSVPNIEGNEWQYIKECLDTGWVSSAGKYVNEFENKISAYTKSTHAIACVNGTAALQIALKLIGTGPGDEIIVPTITFIAPVNAVRYLYAEPVFMDCDHYYNLDTQKVIDFIFHETYFRNGFSFNKITHKKIAAVIPVHIFGNAVDLENLIDICKERNIKVVEDATESLGTVYTKGRFAGKYPGTIGDIGCLSFNGNKIITTGGGGMILTNDDMLAERARYLTTQAKNDEVRYIHDEVGYNYRLTNIQAAMGVAQLEKLDEFLERKKKSYELYKEAIDQIPGLHLAETPSYAENNHWMYALQIDKQIYGKDREELLQHLKENYIQARPVWYLNHLQKPYKDNQIYKIEKAFQMLDITLNIPCSTNLTEEDLKTVVDILQK